MICFQDNCLSLQTMQSFNFLSVVSSVNFRKFGWIPILSLLITNIWVYQDERMERKGLKLETTYSCLDELDIRYSYHLLLSLAYCRCLAIPDTHVPWRANIIIWHQDQVVQTLSATKIVFALAKKTIVSKLEEPSVAFLNMNLSSHHTSISARGYLWLF